ncbi:hypothetical protein [Rheinheimera sp.]|uniref:hypothetical protein n=1 Tax=Rheinheimera sp. TaxID=1869214 RepID=UPI00307D6DE4
MRTLVLLCALLIGSTKASTLTPYQLAFEQDKWQWLAEQLASDTELSNTEKLQWQARIQLANNSAGQVVELLEPSLDANSPDAELWYLAAMAKLQLAQSSSIFSKASHAKQGLAWLQQANLRAPDRLDILTTLIGFYRQAPAIVGGDDEKADAFMHELERKSPVHAVVLRAGLLLPDHAQQALALLEQQPQPQQARWQGAMAQVRLALKQPEAAFSHYQQAAALETDLSDQQGYLYQLGRLAATEQQDLQIGAEALQRYLQFYQDSQHPRLDWAKLRLAEVLLRQQRPQASELLGSLKAGEDKKFNTELKRVKKLLNS